MASLEYPGTPLLSGLPKGTPREQRFFLFHTRKVDEMSDQVAPQGETPETPVEQPASETQAEEFDKERAMATIEKLRGFEKEAKAAKKRLAELEAEDAKRKEAEMTELEKAQKRAAELESQLKAERIVGMKRDAAAKHGLPAELAARLQGETPEELEADAKKLAELLPKKPAQAAVNPGDNASGKGETEAQQRNRIYRRGADVFDPEAIKKRGGGVFWVNPDDKS